MWVFTIPSGYIKSFNIWVETFNIWVTDGLQGHLMMVTDGIFSHKHDHDSILITIDQRRLMQVAQSKIIS